MSPSAAHPSHYSTITSQLSSNSPPTLTSLLHQKLTTSNLSNDQYQTNQQAQPTVSASADKQEKLNDIASGLESSAFLESVALAVSDAVTSVHQQMTTQELSLPSCHHFSHLRQQLESKEPSFHSTSNSTILRKRLSSINIGVAVASAVNQYLTTTIKNNQKCIRNQLNHDENIVLVDGKCLLRN